MHEGNHARSFHISTMAIVMKNEGKYVFKENCLIKCIFDILSLI